MPIYKRGAVYWVTVSHKGQRIRESAGKSRKDAVGLERKILADIHAERLGRKPDYQLSECLLRWLDNECQRLKTPKKHESHARALLPYVKGKRLSQIVQVAEDVKRTMQASAQTINNRVAILRRIANLAYKQWEWLDQDLGKKIALLPTDNTRHVYLLPADVERIAQAAGNNAGDAIRLAAYTGLRRSELLSLTPENVRDGCIVLRTSKTKRPRVVPVPAEAMPILESLPLRVSDGQLRRVWDRVRPDGVRFHDLRHTYASWLVQAGVPLRAVQELMGHSTLAMTQRYSHLDTSHLRDAVETMRKRNKGL